MMITTRDPRNLSGEDLFHAAKSPSDVALVLLNVMPRHLQSPACEQTEATREAGVIKVGIRAKISDQVHVQFTLFTHDESLPPGWMFAYVDIVAGYGVPRTESVVMARRERNFGPSDDIDGVCKWFVDVALETYQEALVKFGVGDREANAIAYDTLVKEAAG